MSNKIENKIYYVLYDTKEDDYYTSTGYLSEFEDAILFDTLEAVSEHIREDFNDWTDEDLAKIEIHAIECKLVNVFKRKIIFETQRE